MQESQRVATVVVHTYRGAGVLSETPYSENSERDRFETYTRKTSELSGSFYLRMDEAIIPARL